MKTRWMITLTMLFLTLPAIAQDEQPTERTQGPLGREWRGPREGRGPEFMLDRLSSRMIQSLELDEQQQVELNQIVAAFRQQVEENMPSPEEHQQLREEMRVARESGDDAGMDELRGRLRELRSGMHGMMDGFFTEVETILDANQVERLGHMRARFAEGQQRGERRRNMRRLIDQIPEQLELTDEQQSRYEELVGELNTQNEARRQHWEEMRPLFEEMREARESGDDERVAEIRSQLEETRNADGNSYETFFGELEKILNDDQKAQLAGLRERPGRRRDQGRTQNVRTILQAVKRINLDSTQRESLRPIIDNATRESKQLNRRDRQAQAELAERVKQDIVRLLTAEQAKQFEQLIQGERPQRNRRDREGNRHGHRQNRSKPEELKPETTEDTP